MKHWKIMAVICLLSSIVAGCAKPDVVRIIKSPDRNVYLTVETFHGAGAISSDFTNIYAHFSQDGKATKQLILGGEYLESADITWTGQDVMAICLREGFTDEFHNEVTLIIDRTSRTLYAFLKESCSVAALHHS
jgi:hypothetical protein